MFASCFYTETGELKPPIMRAAYCAIGLLMGYLVYAAWAGNNDQLATNLMCANAGCGYTDARSLNVGDRVPDICPRCGQCSVYQSLKCLQCAKPLLFNELRGLPGPTRCAHCGTEMPHER